DLTAAALAEPKPSDLQLEPVDGQWAVTDKGRVLHLYSMNSPGTAKLAEEEATFLRNRHLDQQLIRTGDGYATSNCHGWVFAGGRHWVRGDQVDPILRDNGYRQVPVPQPGDVAIFRNDRGEVAHSGVVRGTNAEGRVLLESKWGRLGRFLHTHEQH